MVDLFCVYGDVVLGVYFLYLVVEFFCVDFVGMYGGDGFFCGGYEVVFFGFGEGGYVGGEDFGDVVDLCVNDVEVVVGCFDDDGVEGFGERGVKINMFMGYDVLDVFVVDWIEYFNVVLEDVCFDYLFKVDGFRIRVGDNEVGVWLVFENVGDGGCEEVGVFVVKEVGDDDDNDWVLGVEMFRNGFIVDIGVLG